MNEHIESRESLPLDEFVTLKNMQGVPFTVVYSASGVSFHDRRYDKHMRYGKFVAGYEPDEVLNVSRYGWGLSDPQIDATTMYVVSVWLNHLLFQEEN